MHRGGRLGAMLSTTLAASPLMSVDCLAGISWLKRCRGRGLSMAKLRSPLVANLKSPLLGVDQLVFVRAPPRARACFMR